LSPDLLLGTFDHHPLLEFLPNRVVSARQVEKAIARTIFRCLTDQLKNRPVHAERLMVEGHIWSNGIWRRDEAARRADSRSQSIAAATS
jgi:LacI family fructose operon transcriptional repressor